MNTNYITYGGVLEFKKFKGLQEHWYQKLADSGFVDVEAKHKPLRPNTRTILWKNHDRVLFFYLKLDSFITNNKLPTLHRTILALYSEGLKIVLISNKLGLEYEMVRAVIRKYKKIIINS